MKVIHTAAFLVAFAVIAASLTAPGRLSADDVVERALHATVVTAPRVGDTTWIEDCGIGIGLPPAPPGEGFPRLLAGDADDPAALYELGPDGLVPLRGGLEARGARFGQSGERTFQPRLYPDEITGRSTELALAGERAGLVLDWQTGDRHFALFASGDTQGRAERRLDGLLQRMIHVPAVPRDGLVPLVMEGAYVFTLDGWRREGQKMYRPSPRGWFSLRVFHIEPGAFTGLVALQNDLEVKLRDAGYNRSDAIQPAIAGVTGTVGEYFRGDGFVQRIAYASFPEGFMVALMQAPEASRSELAEQMSALTESFMPTGLSPDSAPAVPFNRVRGVRLVAWLQGREVLWGALFDGPGGEPSPWRQEVPWRIVLDGPGEGLDQREGVARSSRELNPLVAPENRALALPDTFAGEVVLRLTLNGREATASLTIN